MNFRQFLVAGSCLLAALSIGCSVTFPAVLLQQFAANGSSIHLDLDTASWIGSIHGLAGIPSIIMPALMQWKGRRLLFIVACFICIIGWILAYTAKTSTNILISESIHGFGSQSIMAVGLLSMSEMLSPRIRTVSMALYLVVQSLGMVLVKIVGKYMHWRTLSLLMSTPIVVAGLAGFLWPESPFWLAYKGEFNRCEKAFNILRGSDDKTELEELILAQKENLIRDKRKNDKQANVLKIVWKTLKSRDFYMPALHMLVLMNSLYWGGCMVTMIYSSEIVGRITGDRENGVMGSIILNSILFVFCVLSVIPIRYFKTKKMVLVNSLCNAGCLLGASAINYCQTVGLVSSDSYMCFYFLIVYMAVISMNVPIVLTMSAELMPVKHRGIGGPLYVIITCVEHASSLKIAPYLFLYINLWGTFLFYAVNAILCGLFLWKYVPETKGRTLQQLEDFYVYGNFDKRHRLDLETYSGVNSNEKQCE